LLTNWIRILNAVQQVQEAPVVRLLGVLGDRLDNNLPAHVGCHPTKPASLNSCSLAVQDREEQSSQRHLFTFTLSSVIEEIRRWCETGRSCFARWVEKLGLVGRGLPDDGRLSLLDRVIPVPDG